MATKEARPVADDEGHSVMYKSPGSIPGGRGRTYDWAHAKNEDDVADLLERGYFKTLPEAYANAGKPLTKRERGEVKTDLKSIKTSAQDELLLDPKVTGEANTAASVRGGKSAEVERDPITGEPESGSGKTLEDVKGALANLKVKKGLKAVNAIMKQFDVASAPKLLPEQYDAVLTAIDKALAEKPE